MTLLQSCATAPPGRGERTGAWGPSRGPARSPLQSCATAPPGRGERTGAWGPSRGPARSPLQSCATAPPGRGERTGNWGPSRGLARSPLQSCATAPPGRGERTGAWGPFRGPHLLKLPVVAPGVEGFDVRRIGVALEAEGGRVAWQRAADDVVGQQVRGAVR